LILLAQQRVIAAPISKITLLYILEISYIYALNVGPPLTKYTSYDVDLIKSIAALIYESFISTNCLLFAIFPPKRGSVAKLVLIICSVFGLLCNIPKLKFATNACAHPSAIHSMLYQLEHLGISGGLLIYSSIDHDCTDLDEPHIDEPKKSTLDAAYMSFCPVVYSALSLEFSLLIPTLLNQMSFANAGLTPVLAYFISPASPSPILTTQNGFLFLIASTTQQNTYSEDFMSMFGIYVFSREYGAQFIKNVLYRFMLFKPV